MDIYLTSFVIAISTAMLIWSIFDLSSKAATDYKSKFEHETSVNMHELFFTADPTRLFMANVAAMVLCCTLTWLMIGSFAMVVLVAIAFFFVPRMLFNWLRKRRLEQIESQLPDALLMIAGGARAGQSLVLAIRQIGHEIDAPLSQELDVLQREQRLGVSLDDSLENMARRVPVQAVSLTVSAMRIANETGGGLAETLERTAETLRATHAMELKIRALTAQGKMQAWVVGSLPIFFTYVLYKLEPAAMSQLWSSHLGYGVMVTIVVMEFFGVLMIRRIVAIDI